MPGYKLEQNRRSQIRTSLQAQSCMSFACGQGYLVNRWRFSKRASAVMMVGVALAFVISCFTTCDATEQREATVSEVNSTAGTRGKEIQFEPEILSMEDKGISPRYSVMSHGLLAQATRKPGSKPASKPPTKPPVDPGRPPSKGIDSSKYQEYFSINLPSLQKTAEPDQKSVTLEWIFDKKTIIEQDQERLKVALDHLEAARKQLATVLGPPDRAVRQLQTYQDDLSSDLEQLQTQLSLFASNRDTQDLAAQTRSQIVARTQGIQQAEAQKRAIRAQWGGLYSQLVTVNKHLKNRRAEWQRLESREQQYWREWLRLADPFSGEGATGSPQSFETISKWMTQDDKFVPPYVCRAMVYAQRGQRDKALADFEQAIRLEPGFGEAWAGRALIEDLGSHPDQKKAADRSLVKAYQLTKRKSPFVWVCDGIILRRRERYEDAIRKFRDAIRIFPNEPVHHAQLAWTLATTPEPEIRNGNEAAKLAQEAVDLSGGTSPWYLVVLAVSHAEKQDYDTALARIDEANRISAAEIAGLSKGIREAFEQKKAYRSANERFGW